MTHFSFAWFATAAFSLSGRLESVSFLAKGILVLHLHLGNLEDAPCYSFPKGTDPGSASTPPILALIVSGENAIMIQDHQLGEIAPSSTSNPNSCEEATPLPVCVPVHLLDHPLGDL